MKFKGNNEAAKKKKMDASKVGKVGAKPKRKGANLGVNDAKKKKMETLEDGSKKSKKAGK